MPPLKSCFLILICFVTLRVSAQKGGKDRDLIFCLTSKIDVNSAKNLHSSTFLKGNILDLSTGEFIGKNTYAHCQPVNDKCKNVALIIHKKKINPSCRESTKFDLQIGICTTSTSTSPEQKYDFTCSWNEQFNLNKSTCVDLHSQSGNAALFMSGQLQTCSSFSLSAGQCETCPRLAPKISNCRHGESVWSLSTGNCSNATSTEKQLGKQSGGIKCPSGTAWNACSGLCSWPSSAAVGEKCSETQIQCLEDGACSERLMVDEGTLRIPCGTGKIFCMDVEGCFNPDPIFYPPSQEVITICPRGFIFCAKTGSCVIPKRDWEAAIDDSWDDDSNLTCTIMKASIYSPTNTTTCRSDAECPWSSRCCPDAFNKWQCVTFNGSIPRNSSEAFCRATLHPMKKTAAKCTANKDCRSIDDVCCEGFCYSLQYTCPRGLFFCDINRRCIEVLKDNCGKSCPPPSVYCNATRSCTPVKDCKGQFNGGKPWTVMPLSSAAASDGFTLQQVWNTLNSSAVYTQDLYVSESTGCGTWELFTPDLNRWISLNKNQTLRASDLIRVTLTNRNDSDGGVAWMTLHDGIVSRKVVHYFQPPTRVLASTDVPKPLIMFSKEDTPQLINVTSLLALEEIAVNATQFELFANLLLNASAEIDTSSTIFKNMWRFIVDKRRTAGWTVEFRQKPKKSSDVTAALQYSVNGGASWIAIDPTRATGFTDAGVLLKVTPVRDWTGTVELIFTSTAPAEPSSNKFINFLNVVLTVVGENDPPIPRPDIEVDYLPTISLRSNDSEARADFLADRFYTDADGDQLGLLVVLAENTTSGRWQYSEDGSKWTDLILPNPIASRYDPDYIGPVDNPWRNGFQKLTIQALVLKPASLVRFYSQDRDPAASSGLIFTAWDHLPNDTVLTFSLSLPFQRSADLGFSPVFSRFRFEVTGCSGIRGLADVLDRCGVCGGDGSSCTDCSGLFKGNRKAECGICSDSRPVRDCAFQCGSINMRPAGEDICVVKNQSSSLIYCDGTKGSFVNKCGFCVAGRTGLTEKHGMDSCGICFGTNSTCRGCDGVLNSSKTLDSCGKCLSNFDPTRNRCLSFGQWEPRVVDLVYGTRHNISVEIARVPDTVTNLNCRFLALTDVSGRALVRKSAIRNGKLVILADILGMGHYSAVCSWKMNGQPFTLRSDDENYLNVVDSRVLLINSVIPESVLAGVKANVTLVGSSFNEVKIAACVYQLNNQPVRRLKVIESTATRIRCEEVVFSSPGVVVFSAILSEFKSTRIGRNFDSLTQVEAKVSAPVLRILGASLRSTWDLLTLTFNFNVEGPSRCSDIFRPNSTARIGSNSVCFFESNKLQVQLDPSHTILSNTTLNLRYPTTIQITGSPENMEPELFSRSIFVEASVRPMVPDFAIIGPGVVCSRQYSTYESDLPEFYLPNSTFRWNLVGKNTTFVGDKPTVRFLPRESRSSLQLEVNTTLGGSTVSTFRQLSLKTSEVFTLKIQGPGKIFKNRSYFFSPQVEFCNTTRQDRSLAYDWSLSSANLTQKQSTRVFIVPTQLTSGRTYEIKCRVSLSQDPSLYAEDSLTFYVDDPPIEAKISVNSLIVGSENFVLDASESSGSDKDLQFLWRCQQFSEVGCYVMGSTKRLEEYLGFDQLSSSVLEVPGGVLSPGSYNFTVAVYQGMRPYVEATSTVIVNPGDSPRLSLYKLDPRNFVPASFVCTRSCRAYWAVAEEIGTNVEILDRVYFEETTAGAGLEVNFPLKVDNLKIRYGSHDQELRFRLTVQYTEGQLTQATADIKIWINAPPFGGVFSVIPSEVEALVDEVSFTATRWQDQAEDLPLNYHFGFYYDGQEEIKWIGSSLSGSILAPLPSLNELTQIIPVVKVCDARLACTQVEGEPITSYFSPIGKTFLTKVISNARNLMDEGNYVQGLYLTYALAQTVHAGNSTVSITQDVQTIVSSAVDHFRLHQCIESLETIEATKKILDINGLVQLPKESLGKLAALKDRLLSLRLLFPSDKLITFNLDYRAAVADYLLKTTELVLINASPGELSAKEVLTTLQDEFNGICRIVSHSTGRSSRTVAVYSHFVQRPRSYFEPGPTGFSTNHSYIQFDSGYVASDSCLTTIELTEDYLVKLGDYFNVPKWQRRSNIIATFTSTETTISIYVWDRTVPGGTVLQCLAWQDYYWSNSTCLTMQSMTGDSYVDCKCSSSGIYAVFVVPIPERLSVAMVTRNGTFRILEDFYSKVGSQVLEFTASVRSQLSVILVIPTEYFTFLEAKPGSIVINFQLSNLVDSQVVDINNPYQQLSNLLGNGSLQLVDLNGTLLRIPAQSLTGDLFSDATTDSSSDTPILIGVGLAIAFGIVVVLIVICVVCKNKKRERVIDPRGMIRSQYPALYRNFPYENSLDGSNLASGDQRYPNEANIQWALFEQSFGKNNNPWENQLKAWNQVKYDVKTVPEPAKYKEPIKP